MKKIIGILLTMVVLFMVLCATADEVSQPEGGKKFENDWAVEGGIAEIYYEEEGYRVYIKIDKPDALAGSEYEYSCYYHEDTDSLVSISSVRSDYTISPDTGEEIYAEDAVVYEGIDEEEKGTEFIIDEDGFLIWNDGHDNAGDSLKFRNIGRFEGVWRTRFVSSQYASNAQRAALLLPSYCVTDLLLSYRWTTKGGQQIRLGVNIGNLLNSQYVSNAFSGSYIKGGERIDALSYFPQAPIHAMGQFSIRF